MTFTAAMFYRAIATTVALLACATQGAIAADNIAAEFQGDWVPAAASCDSPARLRIEPTKMTLVNGKDSAAYGDIAIAHSFFGPDYDGISIVAMPEFNSGNPPFTVYFNADEKKGVTKLEIYQEIKGPKDAQVQAIQAAARKLAGRFPALNLRALKKCAGR